MSEKNMAVEVANATLALERERNSARDERDTLWRCLADALRAMPGATVEPYKADRGERWVGKWRHPHTGMQGIFNRLALHIYADRHVRMCEALGLDPQTGKEPTP